MYRIKYPVAFHPVDMAITRVHEGRIQVCLAQKVKDVEGGKNLWRFPGGFIDPWDSCAEEASLRESIEETAMKFGSNLVIEAFDTYYAKKKPLTDKLNKLIESGIDDDKTAKEISDTINELHSIKLSDAGLTWLRKNVSYIGSTKIDDARYRDSDHKVITSFYELHPTMDAAGEGPFDDIARTKWFYLSEIKKELMHPAHEVLFNMLFEKYEMERITDHAFNAADQVFEAAEQMFTTFKTETDEMFKDIKKKMPTFEKKIDDAMKNVGKKMENAFKDLGDIFKK